MPRTEETAATDRSAGIEWRATDRERDSVEGLEVDRGVGQRSGNVRVDTVCAEPVGDVVLALGLLKRGEHVGRTSGKTRATYGIDGGELRVGQLRRAQGPRRLLGVVQSCLEQRRAPLDRRHRVVQLMGETS